MIRWTPIAALAFCAACAADGRVETRTVTREVSIAGATFLVTSDGYEAKARLLEASPERGARAVLLGSSAAEFSTNCRVLPGTVTYAGDMMQADIDCLTPARIDL